MFSLAKRPNNSIFSLVDNFFGSHDNSLGRLFDGNSFIEQNFLLPRRLEICDREVLDGRIEYRFALPGMKKENLSVSLIDGKNIEVKSMVDNAGKSSFYYSFSVDKGIDLENITSKLEDGILCISCPRQEKGKESNIKTIEIS